MGSAREKNWCRFLTRQREGRPPKAFDPASVLLGRLSALRADAAGFGDNNDASTTYALRFCPVPRNEHLLASANEDGIVVIKNTADPASSKTCGSRVSFRAHENAIYDVTWSPVSCERVVTASGDKTACLWDTTRLSEGNAEEACVRVFTGHTRSLKVAEFRPNDNNIFSTGSRDNTLCVWDIRSPKPENLIRNAHCLRSVGVSTPSPSRKKRLTRTSQAQSPSTASSNNTITAIKFVDEHRVLSCGDHDGVVKMWDLRRSYAHFRGDPRPVQVFNHPMDSSNRGFVSMIVDSQKRRFYVSCMDSKVYEWDMHASDPRPFRSFVGSDITNFFGRIALSPDDRFLVSGSSDSNAYAWDTSLGRRVLVEPMAVLEGHTDEVTCASWSSADWKLATCSDDKTQFLWKLNADVDDPEKQKTVGNVALRNNEDKENEPTDDQASRKRKRSFHSENDPPARRPLLSL